MCILSLLLTTPAAHLFIAAVISVGHRPGFLAGVVQALDFSETRSISDARMLYDAQNKKKGEKLSKEQYQALRRKGV